MSAAQMMDERNASQRDGSPLAQHLARRTGVRRLARIACPVIILTHILGSPQSGVLLSGSTPTFGLTIAASAQGAHPAATMNPPGHLGGVSVSTPSPRRVEIMHSSEILVGVSKS